MCIYRRPYNAVAQREAQTFNHKSLDLQRSQIYFGIFHACTFSNKKEKKKKK